MHGIVAKHRGFSLIELLIATALGLITISAVIDAIAGFQSTLSDGDMNAEMAAAAEALIEESRADARQDFNLVNPTSTSVGNYAEALTVALGADYATKAVTAKVSYVIGGRTFTTTLATLLSNMENVRAADTCDSTPTGDWSNPQVTNATLASFIGPSGTTSAFTINDLDAYRGRLYVAVASATYKTDPTLFVFDTSDPSRLTLLGSLDNSTSVLSGLAGVRAASDFSAGKIYAYVANKAASQLQIFDVTNGTPVLTKTFKILTASGQGNSIFYRDGYVYEGLTSAVGDEFNVVDVGAVSPASPSNPIWRGSYPVGNGVNMINVKGSYAYVVSPSAQNLLILNITNPYNPQYEGTYTPANAPESDGIGSDHGESVFPVGTNVYLGRTYGSKELYVLDASTPAAISARGAKDIDTGNQTSMYGLRVRDSLAFLVTKAKLDILNITDPLNIFDVGSTSLPGSGVALDCEGNVLYIASNQSGNGVLSVVTAR